MAQKPVKKILLVVPPTGQYIREDRCQTPIEHMVTVTLRPPLDLMYAGASFKAGGAECRLEDYPAQERGEEAFASDLLMYRPDLVLFSITTPGFEDDMRAAALAKRTSPGVVTAAKGAHFNTLSNEALAKHDELDLALRGEFEPACRELAEGKPWGDIAGIAFRDSNGAIVRTPDRPFIEDLDSLPFPDRSLVNNALYLRPDTGEMQTNVVTNRGCPFKCSFCLANQVAGQHNRARSTGNILDEVQECVAEFGIRNFLFRSDLFTADRDWVLELCRGIGERNLKIAWTCNSRVDTLDIELLGEMKRAGCWLVAFGIESGSQETLERINKRTDLDAARKALETTRAAGLLSSVYFMIGFPWDNAETLRANERFAREISPDVLEVFYVYPFPGTPLYDECVELGLLEPGAIPRQAYDSPAMPTLHLSTEDLRLARDHAMRNFYLRPRIILRTLMRARSPRELWNYVRYGCRQLKEML